MQREVAEGLAIRKPALWISVAAWRRICKARSGLSWPEARCVVLWMFNRCCGGRELLMCAVHIKVALCVTARLVSGQERSGLHVHGE